MNYLFEIVVANIIVLSKNFEILADRNFKKNLRKFFSQMCVERESERERHGSLEWADVLGAEEDKEQDEGVYSCTEN